VLAVANNDTHAKGNAKTTKASDVANKLMQMSGQF
jgi:hypothetical protein